MKVNLVIYKKYQLKLQVYTLINVIQAITFIDVVSFFEPNKKK